MKTPIEPQDIRKGDLFRVEYADGQASELYASGPQHKGWGTKHFILKRARSAVVLPTVPTLGWVAGPETHPLFDSWSSNNAAAPGPNYVTGKITKSSVCRHEVTAFTPATAVPTDALDLLRNDVLLERTHGGGSSFGEAADDFLAAVDAANGSSK